jgi:asparagine N-glycosylation enzyme membrane subunit Stt3
MVVLMNFLLLPVLSYFRGSPQHLKANTGTVVHQKIATVT